MTNEMKTLHVGFSLCVCVWIIRIPSLLYSVFMQIIVIVYAVITSVAN